MNEKKITKIVEEHHDRLVSTTYKNNFYTVIYEVDTWTKTKIGKLLVFDSLENAKYFMKISDKLHCKISSVKLTRLLPVNI